MHSTHCVQQSLKDSTSLNFLRSRKLYNFQSLMFFVGSCCFFRHLLYERSLNCVLKDQTVNMYALRPFPWCARHNGAMYRFFSTEPELVLISDVVFFCWSSVIGVKHNSFFLSFFLNAIMVFFSGSSLNTWG